MATELDTPYVHFELKDSLLIAVYKKGIRINLPMAQQIVQSRLAFTGPKRLLVLILSEGGIRIDKAARDYMASEAGTEGLIAAAMVPNNSFDWALGSFFLYIRKPAMPTRVFYNRDTALQWLKKFVY